MHNKKTNDLSRNAKPNRLMNLKERISNNGKNMFINRAKNLYVFLLVRTCSLVEVKIYKCS